METDITIGGCRLICGDVLEWLPRIESASCDFIFTDPPYGHNNNNGDLIHHREAALGLLPSGSDSPQGRQILNDGKEANELFRAILSDLRRVLQPGCCCCCCCSGGGPDPQFARWSLWLDEVLDFKQMVVWDKGPMGMGWHYRRSYETVLVAQVPGAACRWYDESNQVENVIRPYGRIRKIIPRSDQHPTEKPVELAEHFILLHTREDDLVLDPFMGSASTAIACVRTGRRFLGIEKDEKFFVMAVNRIRKAVADVEREGLFLSGGERTVQPQLFGEAV